MYSHWDANLWVALVTLLSVGAVVLVHYEGLSLLSRRLMVRHAGNPRRKVLFGVLGVLVLHMVEIWLFGTALWWLVKLPDTGSVIGTTCQ